MTAIDTNLCAVGDSSLCDDGSDLTDLSQDQIDHLLKDTNEISKLLRRWQSQQTEEAASVPWTKEDKLRKRISDLIETEADYVRVCMHAKLVGNSVARASYSLS